MKAKVESYVELLSMKDSGIRLNFEDISDEQLAYFCMDEDLIDTEIAFLYNTTPEEVRRRRHQAYLNHVHLLQEKLLQDHFVVMSNGGKESDISGVKSENVRKMIDQIHGLSNSELDELLDYIILNNKKLSSTIIRP